MGYVDMGTSATSTAKLTFYSATGTSIANRLWNVKVSQIECSSEWRAPPDCTQYFMGVRNTVFSYNYLGQQFTDDQDYTNCVRREVGYCGLRWRQTGTTSPDSFGIDLTTGPAAAKTNACVNGWISIPGGVTFATVTSGTTYFTQCGTDFAEEAKTVQSETNTTPSFLLNVYSKKGATILATDVGFAMRYEQQMCS